jgi:hypothetical protein
MRPSARLASTSRTLKPRMNPAITSGSSALVRVTPGAQQPRRDLGLQRGLRHQPHRQASDLLEVLGRAAPLIELAGQLKVVA